eukprot:22485-Chlamydomonas_euryale.AAC.1
MSSLIRRRIFHLIAEHAQYSDGPRGHRATGPQAPQAEGGASTGGRKQGGAQAKGGASCRLHGLRSFAVAGSSALQ